MRSLYHPVQPSIRSGNKEISYTEIQPHSSLQDFIYCFWELKTKRMLSEPYVYRVVSDGCIDIFFNADRPAENFVMGFCRKYTEFPIGSTFNFVGIRFFPSVFPTLFNVDAGLLSNQSQDLKNILPALANALSKEVQSSQSFGITVEWLTKKIMEAIQESDQQSDKRFLNALKQILLKKGFLDIEKDLDTGLSPRQLRRVFNYYLGTTPKAFSNVVRFQHILGAKPSMESLKKNKIYLDVGFFDQAHFIKDFKKFYGVTPTEAFQ